MADYKPEKASVQKIKRNAESIELKLVKTPDILRSVASLKKPPFTVGFSAETENLLKNASKNLVDKKIDMIAANLVGDGKGFSSDQNELVVISKNGKSKNLSLKDKTALAYELLIYISQQYKKF